MKNNIEKLEAAKFVIPPERISYTGKRIGKYYFEVDSLRPLFPAGIKNTDSIRCHTQKAITKLYSQCRENTNVKEIKNRCINIGLMN